MLTWLGGRQVGFEDVGSGDPVLFLHGFPHRRSLWAPQLGGLIDRARCVAMDLRGFGESEPTQQATVDDYADDAAALLDQLNVERAVVCGLSMGGYAAMAMWRRHADRIRGLVLMDTRAGADSPEAARKRLDMEGLARERGSGAVADAMIAGMVGKSTRERFPEVVDALHAMLESAPVEGIVSALHALRTRPDSTQTLASISVPTLIVVGEEDALTPVRDAHAMHATIPGSRLEVIAMAGHVSNVERPAAVNHVLSEFLASLTLA